MRRSLPDIVLIALTAFTPALAVRAQSLTKQITADGTVALNEAEQGDWRTALAQANAAFDLAVAYGSQQDVAVFRQAAFVRRMIFQLQPLEADRRGDLLDYLRKHDDLAHTLVFAVRDGDNVKGVYGLLDELRSKRAEQVEEFPELTAALCVVRDVPLKRQLNENTVRAAEPIDVFDFYVQHERQMFFGLRHVPVDLLIYVVDSTASIDEMNWALRKYGGTANVGKLFFDISYDYAAFEGTAKKKVTEEGYSLANILKYGGVCIDQAYFATSVGKAIGVPSTIATGADADASHAWVGFLQSQGRRAAWNFNSGRYESFQGVRGNVVDPQTGKRIADSYVSLLGESIGASATDRETAISLIEAARRLSGEKREGGKFVAPDQPVDARSARAADCTSELELIEMGLRQCPAYSPGWDLVADLAQNGQMSEAQKRKWSDLAQRLCGQKYPDFTLAVVGPMIETENDPATQSRLWDSVFPAFANRFDLAAQIRMKQAALWEENGDLPRAGQFYEQVIQKYINAGPFALKAVKGAQGVLEKLGKSSSVLDLYAQAVKLVEKPDQQMAPEFLHQSNWYKLREAYADLLDEAGKSAMAAAIRAQDSPAGAASP